MKKNNAGPDWKDLTDLEMLRDFLKITRRSLVLLSLDDCSGCRFMREKLDQSALSLFADDFATLTFKEVNKQHAFEMDLLRVQTFPQLRYYSRASLLSAIEGVPFSRNVSELNINTVNWLLRTSQAFGERSELAG